MYEYYPVKSLGLIVLTAKIFYVALLLQRNRKDFCPGTRISHCDYVQNCQYSVIVELKHVISVWLTISISLSVIWVMLHMSHAVICYLLKSSWSLVKWIRCWLCVWQHVGQSCSFSVNEEIYWQEDNVDHLVTSSSTSGLRSRPTCIGHWQA